MRTSWDWTTLGIFCALAVLFLQRSVGTARRGDHIVTYLPPALGCAAVNFLGNAGRTMAAATLLFCVFCYMAVLLLRRTD